MRLNLYFLSLLFLCLSFSCFAQQVPPEVEQLQKSVAEARQLLNQVRRQREQLRSLHAGLQDSAAFEAALDSLRQAIPNHDLLQQRMGSLSLAFSDHQAALQQLDEAERRLQQEISRATAALAQKLLPEESAKLLEQLRQAKELSAESMLPSDAFMKEFPQQLPSAEKLAETAKAKALKTAEDHLAGQQERLNQKWQELGDYQSRVKKMPRLKDAPKGILKKDTFRDKPWPGRVVLGTQWQFGKQERFTADLGPYLGWRFTENISSGAGFQYRLSVSTEEKPWVSSTDRVLGYFAFTDAEVYKGFFARLYYEHLSATYPRVNAAGQAEEADREWVKGLAVGAGKSFTLYGGVKACTVLQYNLLHERGKTPYLQPLQAKIGFFLYGDSLLKRKKKATEAKL
ncbi:hypothetical protein ACFSKU_08730 [Pontibacter silvestris]|uniref:DUF3575 domain-containing protein n=1 Tax=Pontibacter silvestris TaxID=2305183 RepID=A0ABW4WXR1_9BACT|nr:hypothetical protein [Pontibacter silvestris]MCC9138776.1 hypothetical protein [Pontibacter silvestris]